MNYKLEEMKKQVANTSNEQYKIQTRKQELIQEVNDRDEYQEQTQREITQLVRSIMGQSEVANAQDRELLQDKIDKFSLKQQLMNEQVIKLNSNITSVTALESLYEAKRNELEICYQEQENSLKRRIKALERKTQQLANEATKIQTEIVSNNSKLEKIKKDIKNFSLLKSFKNKFVGHYLMYIIVGIVVFIIINFLGENIINLF